MPYHDRPRLDRLGRLVDRLAAAAYQPLTDLTVEAWRTTEPVPFADRTSGAHLAVTPGTVWGELFDCAWFHFTGTVPTEAAGQPVVVLIDINGEALVVDAEGNPRQCLTNVNSEYDYSLGKPGKRVVPVTDAARGGETIDLWADAGCNDLFGKLQGGGALKEAQIALVRPSLHALWYDVEVLWELARQLPDDSARRKQLLSSLMAVSLELREFTEDEAARARALLAPELAKRGGDPSLTISAIGHAHIDLAWLWPLRETIRKGARTFSTALRFMEQYPDYHFGCSQPQLYAWMKEHYPTLYAEVQARVAEGRWEVQGGMWVEPDTNVPSGESLVRQLLYGKRYFRAEFGVDVKGLWLPDVFGYSAALPQIMRSAGLDWFMTQKLSWSLVNAFPHQTFRWQGLDGSEVVAHMLPEETYNSSAAPRALAKTERNFRDKAVSDRALMLFGIGDGGGGPGEEHLERLAREGNLAGLPPVIQEPSQRFFERILPDAERYPRWVGELYLERHQGTYTTQARNKRYNRRLEQALREAELACARATWETGQAYPLEAFDAIWKEVLLYQFHDILPGSSITRVYTESLARYAALLSQVEALRDSTLHGGSPVLVNDLSWDRAEWVKLGDDWRWAAVPALGSAAPVETFAPWQTPTATTTLLENEHLRVTLADDGSIASLWDKDEQREALAPGGGNVLALYDDDGDAWDFPMDYRDRTPDRPVLASSEVLHDGPRAVVRQRYTCGQSTLVQDVTLLAGSRRLDFVCRADWRESGRMLRTSFAVATSAHEAACEIQFGHVKRATHVNTSWDLARFEVCAQKWIDLSDRGYGVALLNDCKYGHHVAGNLLDLNLLRSPGFPDPVADRAAHEFTYSLYPHAGDTVAGGVARAGYELNVPLRAAAGAAQPSLLSVASTSVIVEAVKRAEDSDALIVRLYEADGGWCRTRVTLPPGTATAALVNVLEEQPEPLAIQDGTVELSFRGFEVKTLRLTR